MADTDTGTGTGTSSRTGTTRRRSARERLLAAAARRFYADGVAATGIDTITAEAGVAKMSLYNNFSSKSELVMAYLDARHEEWLGLYRRRLEEAGGGRPADGRAGVLAVFDAYADHAALAYERGFRGCGLLNAAAELPADHEGRAVVRRHKEQVESLLTGHLQELLPGRPEEARTTAEHLSFLLEGAMARAGLEGASTRLEHARAMAANLLDRLERPDRMDRQDRLERPDRMDRMDRL
ncbi:TetR/AcrR family transcriptional regulator [Streptomyces sp. NPDC003374]